MILREFMYFDKETEAPQEDDRYLSQTDTGILKNTDLRKTRLTLSMLNDLRKAGDTREKEKKQELGLTRKMYASPPPEAGPM